MKLLTVVEVGEALQVSPARVYELIRTGAMPAVWIGRQVRISPGALAQWIDCGGQPLPGGWRREPFVGHEEPSP
jgi:excisionase family DNA binding protein